MRSRAELLDAAARAGLTLTAIETLPGGELSARFTFDDPWAAARFLEILTQQDAEDPIVRQWALEILQATAESLGMASAGPTLSPRLVDTFARALWANVQSQIRFRHEKIETFQAARETMRVGAGDCDDSARLLVALALSAGLPARLIFLDTEDQPTHVVAQLRDSSGWQWAETTIDAAFGEAPLDALDRILAEGGEVDANPFERPDAGDPMGLLDFVTAGNVRDYKTELDATIASLDHDATSCATLPAATLAAWNDWLVGWRTFLADDPSWWDAGAQGRQAGQYAADLRQWQDTIAKSCPLSAPKIADTNTDSLLLGTVKTVAVAVAVVAGVYGAVQVARTVRVARALA